MSEPEAGKSVPPPTEPGTPPQAGSAMEVSRDAVHRQPQAPASQVSIEEFRKIDLRVGVVVAAEDHPNADRLLVLNVDIGDGTPRKLVAGIKGAYQASALIGKQVVVVANLKPAMLRGIESQGMVLAAQDGTQLALLTLERPIQPGGTVK